MIQQNKFLLIALWSCLGFAWCCASDAGDSHAGPRYPHAISADDIDHAYVTFDAIEEYYKVHSAGWDAISRQEYWNNISNRLILTDKTGLSRRLQERCHRWMLHDTFQTVAQELDKFAPGDVGDDLLRQKEYLFRRSELYLKVGHSLWEESCCDFIHQAGDVLAEASVSLQKAESVVVREVGSVGDYVALDVVPESPEEDTEEGEDQ